MSGNHGLELIGGSVTTQQIEANLPSSVASSSPIDLRSLIGEVTQEEEIAAKLNAAFAKLPPGALVKLPPLANPVTLSGAGEKPFQKATIYLLESALELVNEIGIIGPGPGSGRVMLRCKTGFSDSQMVRNWKSTDWEAGRESKNVEVTNGSKVVKDASAVAEDNGKLIRDARASSESGLGHVFGVKAGSTITAVTPGVSYEMSNAYTGATGTINVLIGESDHWIAPLKTATPLYYPIVRDIGFDLNGASGVTCLARVHPQEQACIQRVVYRNTGAGAGGNFGRADFSNGDSAGTIAGVQTCEGEIGYGKGWSSFVLQDHTCGGKLASPAYPAGGAVIRDMTLPVSSNAEEAFSSSPIKLVGVSHVNVGPIHQECFPGATAGQLSFADGITVSGSNVLKTAGAIIFSGHHVGREVTDSEGAIPAGTIITKYLSTTEVELSAAATASKNPDTITLGSGTACIRLMDCNTVKLDSPTITPHYEVTRPWIRATASGVTPASVPIFSPVVLGGRLAITPGSSQMWKSGAPIIEDYTGDGLLRRLVRETNFDPRVLQRYDGDEMLWGDAETGTLRSARVQPRQAPTGDLWTPARNGLKAANADPGSLPSTAVALSSGVLFLTWVPCPWNLKMTGVYWAKTEVGEITEGQSFVGAYSAAGKLLAQTTGRSKANWEANTANWEKALWRSLGAGSAKTGPGVWVAFLKNGAGNLKLNATGVQADSNFGISAEKEVLRAATYGESQTSLPSELTLANLVTATTAPIWAALT